MHSSFIRVMSLLKNDVIITIHEQCVSCVITIQVQQAGLSMEYPDLYNDTNSVS